MQTNNTNRIWIVQSIRDKNVCASSCGFEYVTYIAAENKITVKSKTLWLRYTIGLPLHFTHYRNTKYCLIDFLNE